MDFSAIRTNINSCRSKNMLFLNSLRIKIFPKSFLHPNASDTKVVHASLACGVIKFQTMYRMSFYDLIMADFVHKFCCGRGSRTVPFWVTTRWRVNSIITGYKAAQQNRTFLPMYVQGNTETSRWIKKGFTLEVYLLINFLHYFTQIGKYIANLNNAN
jgi:hypothetical protein